MELLITFVVALIVFISFPKIHNWFKKELVFKLDFVNYEFEVGWVWFILLLGKLLIELLHWFVIHYC